MTRTKMFLYALFILTLLLSCGRESVTPVVVLVAGNVQIKDPGKEFAPAKTAQVIRKGDIIRTGPKSMIAIQFGDAGTVQIAANSTVEAKSLLDSGSGELFLSSGTVITGIRKLMKGNSFAVKTPTTIAAVRGTVFSVTYWGKGCTVGVSNGEVTVTHLKSGNAELVRAGKAADIIETITIRDLTKIESLVLDKADIVAPIDGAQKLSPESLELKGKSYLPGIEKIDKEIEKLLSLSLAKIREKYGRIDVVTLYSGKVFRGAITSRGASMKMITPHGPVSIPAHKVKNTGLQ